MTRYLIAAQLPDLIAVQPQDAVPIAGTWIGDNAIDLVGLLGALVLLGVTAWYTKVTKDMSKTAERAANDSAKATGAAERAAAAALEAARVAQSQIRPEFVARTVLLTTDETSRNAVEIAATGDPVVVQKVTVKRAFRGERGGGLDGWPGRRSW